MTHRSICYATTWSFILIWMQQCRRRRWSNCRASKFTASMENCTLKQSRSYLALNRYSSIGNVINHPLNLKRELLMSTRTCRRGRSGDSIATIIWFLSREECGNSVTRKLWKFYEKYFILFLLHSPRRRTSIFLEIHMMIKLSRTPSLSSNQPVSVEKEINFHPFVPFPSFLAVINSMKKIVRCDDKLISLSDAAVEEKKHMWVVVRSATYTISFWRN